MSITAREIVKKLVKGGQLYEGKAKKVFATNYPDPVIMDYKDDATAFTTARSALPTRDPRIPAVSGMARRTGSSPKTASAVISAT
jgi:hypothetical protein